MSMLIFDVFLNTQLFAICSPKMAETSGKKWRTNGE
jgi:hypothetical protein